MFKREATSENYGPGVYFIIIAKTLNHFTVIYFVLSQSSIYNFNLAIDHREIDNLSFALGARVCYLCAGAAYVVLLGSPSGLITLVS